MCNRKKLGIILYFSWLNHFVFLGVQNTTSFQQLEQLASELVDQVQTGGLSESLNVVVEDFAMAEPVAEPVDSTGGVRATNESGMNTRCTV